MALFNQTFHYERDQAWTFSYCSIKHQNNWQTTCVFLFDSCSTYNIKRCLTFARNILWQHWQVKSYFGNGLFYFRDILWSMFTWLHNLPWLQKNKPFFYSRISQLRTVLQWSSINTTTLSSLTELSFRWKERNCIKEVIVRQSRFT